jgi:hypothetical protein
VANRRITEFPAIAANEIVDQDVMTLVHVFEVDPSLRNKKITFSQFRDYLDLYYAPGSGALISGNVTITGNLTVGGNSSFNTVTASGLSTFSGIVVQNNATVSGTISGTTVTGTFVQGSQVNAVTGTFTTLATGATASFPTGNFTSLTGTTTSGVSAFLQMARLPTSLVLRSQEQPLLQPLVRSRSWERQFLTSAGIYLLQVD